MQVHGTLPKFLSSVGSDDSMHCLKDKLSNLAVTKFLAPVLDSLAPVGYSCRKWQQSSSCHQREYNIGFYWLPEDVKGTECHLHFMPNLL